MSISTVEELQQSLSNTKKTLIMLGCVLLFVALAAYGLSLSTIQGPILEAMNASEHFSLVTILGSLGMCLMTPVGGKLSDMYGARNVVFYGSIIGAVAGIALGFSSTFIPFVMFRLLLSFALGSYVSVPFILVREIYPVRLVPRMVGLLTAVLSLGGLVGSFGAGFFVDQGNMFLAIAFPVIFMIPGAILVYFNLPQKPIVHEPFDVFGFITLSVGISAFFLSLNFGTKVGWSNPFILLGLLLGVVSIILFIFVEKKAKEPLIPLRLFKNERLMILIAVGFFSFFYFNAMNVYVPLGVIDVMGQSATITGTLQVPRTIISVILPFILGVWVVKKVWYNWFSLAMAGLVVGIAFSFLVFLGPNMPVWFVMTMLALTGFAESFRSVSYTPAVQNTLPLKDLGIGTSLTSFFNSLAGVIASTLFGFAYDQLVLTNEGIKGVTMGVDTVFLIAAVSGFIAFILVIASFIPTERKYLREKAAQEAQAKEQAAKTEKTDAKQEPVKAESPQNTQSEKAVKSA